MGIRLIALALVTAAVVADAQELSGAAFYLLVAGVPAAAIAALSRFGDLVELSGDAPGQAAARVHALLAVLGLGCVLVAAAVRAHAVEAGAVPAVGSAALLAFLVIAAGQEVAAVALSGRRRAESRA